MKIFTEKEGIVAKRLYSPEKMPGLVEDLLKKMDRLLESIRVLDSVTKILENLVETISRDAHASRKYGYVWLCRGGTGSFYIQYTPSEFEKKELGISYIQWLMAEGDFLEKKLKFSHYLNDVGHLHLKTVLVPALAQLFESWGFWIEYDAVMESL